ncbi:hypothetical protein [Bacillus sp. FJAT-47783]|uniref:SA1320 family protein n=1 Tax=Bacillus sp. FJAT-47783 TaxID=2922712 RepID=UPI001FAE02CB|nr:hypothetical protein [Bacillus sp. FJAT-47783]
MEKTEILQKTEDINNDQDLVELAGNQAYFYPQIEDNMQVNGKEYKVIDTIYNHPTGLDALTVVNTKTDEITIIFVGTDAGAENGIQDIITDVQLLSKLTPEQMKAARDYFDKMNEKYKAVGGVSSICGNSLGGGLTNAVAVENPEVKAVTLNPAILPSGMVDTSKNYSNITNYFSQYDVLTLTETALGLGHRIPGKQYKINNGIPEFLKFVTNHTGYLRNEDGIQFYTIGKKGKPGFGEIYIDADEHIVTSIWTGEPLYERGSERIEINKENLLLLSKALGERVIKRINLFDDYLGNSIEIVEDEGNKINERINKLRFIFQQLFEDAVGDPFLKGAAFAGNTLKLKIEGLISILNTVELKCQSLNIILNSPPAELVEHVINKNISVESIIVEARYLLYSLIDKIDEVTYSFDYIMKALIPDLFKGGRDQFIDAVVGELLAHYEIIKINKSKILHQLSDFQKRVYEVSEAFQNRDEGLAQAIENNTLLLDGTEYIQQLDMTALNESPYMMEKMRLKEIMLEVGYGVFSAKTYELILPLFGGLQMMLFSIENTLETLSLTVKGTTNILLKGTFPGQLMSLFTDFDDKIKKAINGALEPIDEIAATIEGVRKGVGNLIAYYPLLLKEFKPYVHTALFNETSYYNVHLYNLAAISILEEMDLLFQDIVHQLSDHKAKAIDALCETSKRVLENMRILEEQVNRVTLT